MPREPRLECCARTLMTHMPATVVNCIPGFLVDHRGALHPYFSRPALASATAGKRG